MARGIEFVKGHGTENDFVLLPDAEAALDLNETRVRALCDRRRGLGADGVLRVAATSAVPDAPAETSGTAWFMDYRNADGSVAEMCGNGARVFARYLVDAGLAAGPGVRFGTRAGARSVRLRPDGSATVDMGTVTVLGRAAATVGGLAYDGTIVDAGNPHLVCSARGSVDTPDLSTAPEVDQTLFPHGVNVEFVQMATPGRLRVRVHERGVGETRSCGTGAVAAAAAWLAGQDDGDNTLTLENTLTPENTLTLELPGGPVQVTIRAGEASLTGQAVLLARGHIDQDWWLST